MTEGLLAELGPPLLKMKAVCEYLSVCETTGYALVNSGRLKSVRVGKGDKGIRVSIAALKEYKLQSEGVAAERVVANPLPPVHNPKHAKPRKIQPRRRKVAS